MLSVLDTDFIELYCSIKSKTKDKFLLHLRDIITIFKKQAPITIEIKTKYSYAFAKTIVLMPTIILY